MSTSHALRNLNSGDPARPFVGELRLDPLVHGRARVPGQQTPLFDLAAFAVALGRHDVAYLLARYAPDADIRVIDADGPPVGARSIRGSRAIRSCLDNKDALVVEVTHLVDGGDRVAFTECRQQRHGTTVMATSTADLCDGLITTQHTILAWAYERRDPIDGWTRLSTDLWTTTD